mmetsp:Transcript_1394/g.4352  ORF Transcript_1394/g.4352 Transcript_1394/m.4352 type:complete len:218 (-) Transcript_1394:613-1266(-)
MPPSPSHACMPGPLSAPLLRDLLPKLTGLPTAAVAPTDLTTTLLWLGGVGQLPKLLVVVPLLLLLLLLLSPPLATNTGAAGPSATPWETFARSNGGTAGRLDAGRWGSTGGRADAGAVASRAGAGGGAKVGDGGAGNCCGCRKRASARPGASGLRGNCGTTAEARPRVGGDASVGSSARVGARATGCGSSASMGGTSASSGGAGLWRVDAGIGGLGG